MTLPLDWIAMGFVLSGSALVRFRKTKGWLLLAVGSVLHAAVALLATFNGRPIWGSAVQSCCTLALNLWAYFSWRAEGVCRTKST